jgi:hypothetical protein
MVPGTLLAFRNKKKKKPPHRADGFGTVYEAAEKCSSVIYVCHFLDFRCFRNIHSMFFSERGANRG